MLDHYQSRVFQTLAAVPHSLYGLTYLAVSHIRIQNLKYISMYFWRLGVGILVAMDRGETAHNKCDTFASEKRN